VKLSLTDGRGLHWASELRDIIRRNRNAVLLMGMPHRLRYELHRARRFLMRRHVPVITRRID
jgi:hypothetical protein